MLVSELPLTWPLKVCAAPPAWTVDEVGLMDTPRTSQVPVSATEGAVLVALVDLTVTTPESERPASSVTVNLRVTLPDAGATMVAVEVSAP